MFIANDTDELITKFVRPSDHVHLAATLSRPNALQSALCRAFHGTKSLTISTAAIHSSAHALALSECCRKVVTGFLGDTYPSPRPNRLYRNLSSGEPFEVELWTLLTYTQRLMAAALGQPFCTTSSDLQNSSLGQNKGSDLQTANLTDGRTVTLLTALKPDIALFHGICADKTGNVVLSSPYGEGPWSAYAAKRGVLASVEQIVEDCRELGMSSQVMIPAAQVLGICEAKWGAHPNSLGLRPGIPIDGYLDDYDQLKAIAEACRTPDKANEWFEEWVLFCDHAEYIKKLEKTGATSRLAIRDGRKATGKIEIVSDATPPTDMEKTIILGAREIERQVKTVGYDVVLAGIGASHIATWLAIQSLRAAGYPTVFAAELGIVGNLLKEGDVFLFSQQHAQLGEFLAGIPEILGGLVATHNRTLGVLSTAEIDESGNLNTTLLSNGRWLTGCGGANDIASTSDCIVIASASPRRYVSKLDYVTSPGARVTTAVTQFGVFRKSKEGKFSLSSWLPQPDTTPVEIIRQTTTWTPTLNVERVQEEKQILSEELDRLRRLDREGYYR